MTKSRSSQFQLIRNRRRGGADGRNRDARNYDYFKPEFVRKHIFSLNFRLRHHSPKCARSFDTIHKYEFQKIYLMFNRCDEKNIEPKFEVRLGIFLGTFAAISKTIFHFLF